MPLEHPLPMIRCHLDGSEDSRNVRYVPASEFELWRHFMASQHGRPVTVDEVSVWLPEDPAILDDDDIDVERLEPVLRVRFEKSAPEGAIVVPVVRFLPSETYPEAKEALLGHFDEDCRRTLEETPGYFVTGTDEPDMESAA